MIPGRKKLMAWGIRARAAQEIAALAKRLQVDLDQARARILEGQQPMQRETTAAGWIGKPLRAPEEKPATPSKKPKPAKAELEPKEKPARPARKPRTPDRPQGHGGSLLTGPPPQAAPRPSHGSDCELQAGTFADEVRFVSTMVAKARVDYLAAQAEYDEDPCDETEEELRKREIRMISLVKTYGNLTASLDSAAGLGDTRSLAEIIRTLTEAAAFIRADVQAIPQALSDRLANAGGHLAAAAAEVRDMAQEVVTDALISLSNRFEQVTKQDA